MGRRSAADDLLARCEAARKDGSDFPTIWVSILRTSPLVIGLPTHDVRDGNALIVIKLADGQVLLSSTSGFSLDWRD